MPCHVMPRNRKKKKLKTIIQLAAAHFINYLNLNSSSFSKEASDRRKKNQHILTGRQSFTEQFSQFSGISFYLRYAQCVFESTVPMGNYQFHSIHKYEIFPNTFNHWHIKFINRNECVRWVKGNNDEYTELQLNKYWLRHSKLVEISREWFSVSSHDTWFQSNFGMMGKRICTRKRL